eukprot:TRINITY_DN1130_c0_g1_i1.p1 TRINITY_DN1130_c0_g1~~TRINITY_DN1130_c0_g1_i1.p1  ORF type:complete len:220 (+),score=46.70 TRINITY_DN1130_c0_g1_i1:143-802(+)
MADVGNPAADVERTDAEREEGEITPEKDPGPSSSAETVSKHPLEHHWTLWFDNPAAKKGGQWGSSLRPVYTFGTVEDFWCLYNNVVQPSRLVAGADFHCFKKGIEPMWEDPKCASGGKWTAVLPRGNKQALDTSWLHTLLAMIGEQFEEGDDICGAVVQIRNKQDRIALWTKTASNESMQMSIGKQWRGMVADTNEKLGYLVHDDAKRQEKKAKDRYTL